MSANICANRVLIYELPRPLAPPPRPAPSPQIIIDFWSSESEISSKKIANRVNYSFPPTIIIIIIIIIIILFAPRYLTPHQVS